MILTGSLNYKNNANYLIGNFKKLSNRADIRTTENLVYFFKVLRSWPEFVNKCEGMIFSTHNLVEFLASLMADGLLIEKLVGFYFSEERYEALGDLDLSEDQTRALDLLKMISNKRVPLKNVYPINPAILN